MNITGDRSLLNVFSLQGLTGGKGERGPIGNPGQKVSKSSCAFYKEHISNGECVN